MVISLILVAIVAYQKIRDQYVKIMDLLCGEMNVGGKSVSDVLLMHVVMNVVQIYH